MQADASETQTAASAATHEKSRKVSSHAGDLDDGDESAGVEEARAEDAEMLDEEIDEGLDEEFKEGGT